jgi:hypothetical protein
MKRERWKKPVAIVGAIAAAAVLGLVVTVFAYGRSHPAQVALIHATPSGQASIAPLYSPSASVRLSSSPAAPSSSEATRGTGIGPPHAATVSELGSQPGCDETSSASGLGSGPGPCGNGVYHACLYEPGNPICNQQLSNGITCGSPSVGCIPAQLSCRLPIFGGGSGSGGFISLPTGDFKIDPASNVSAPGGSPYLAGETYDRFLSRWLPVPPSWVSPDEGHYAYADQAGAVHNVDAASSADKTLTTSGSWQLLRYATVGIYAVPIGSTPTPGLWLFSASAAPKQITASGYWNFIGGGAAYGNAAASYPTGAGNQVMRLDLNTGLTTPWFQRPGYDSAVMGVDGDGRAIVQATSSVPYTQPELWLAVGAESGIKLLQSYPTTWPTMSDKRGLWLTTNAQYTPGIVLLTIVTDANGVAHPIFDRVSTVVGQIAGDCVS